MKLWARDKYVEVTLLDLKKFGPSEAAKMRHLMGRNLSVGLPTLGNPFSYVDDIDGFNNSLGSLFRNASINDIDVATTILISGSKGMDSASLEQTSVKAAAAFLKASANIATFRKKKKSPKKDQTALYEFFAKMALNAIIEFNASEERTANAY